MFEVGRYLIIQKIIFYFTSLGVSTKFTTAYRKCFNFCVYPVQFKILLNILFNYLLIKTTINGERVIYLIIKILMTSSDR